MLIKSRCLLDAYCTCGAWGSSMLACSTVQAMCRFARCIFGARMLKSWASALIRDPALDVLFCHMACTFR